MRAVRLCVRHLSGIKSVEIPAQVLQDLLFLKGGIGSLRGVGG
jgi:hypothetical protein